MKTEEKTRHDNLLLLIKAVRYQKQLADIIGVTDSYLSRLKSGEIAITRGKAAIIEGQCSLPIGWMDTPHDTIPALKKKETPSTVAKQPEASYEEQTLLENYRQLPEPLRKAVILIVSSLGSQKKGYS